MQTTAEFKTNCANDKMSSSPKKRTTREPQYKIPKKVEPKRTRAQTCSPSLKPSNEEAAPITTRRRSTRKISPTIKTCTTIDQPSCSNKRGRKSTRQQIKQNSEVITEQLNGELKEEEEEEMVAKDTAIDTQLEMMASAKPTANDVKLLQTIDVAGCSMFGFNTPKKRGGMAIAAMNTPKTSKTPKLNSKTPRKTAFMPMEPKTPSHLRNRVKDQIAKMIEINSESDFSEDESDFVPSEEDDDDDDDDNGGFTSSSEGSSSRAQRDNECKLKTPWKGGRRRGSIIVPILPKTPSAVKVRTSTRRSNLKQEEFVPASDDYFQSHSNTKSLTSDHTLDRLKNPRLAAEQLFSLLANLKLTEEHKQCINAMSDDYKTDFPKWLFILNEGFNILLYGLGSKRNLLHCFHRTYLKEQTVLIVNGFFPGLTIKDILDSITDEILNIGVSASNPHEAVDTIEEELNSNSDAHHLYLIVHNIDGTMLRNPKAQSVLSRLASIRNIHLLASIDHINTPLLWDQTKLSNFNFSWWDCTIMLPYSDETAFENSLLVQNSGELALSSLRSVFSSLTTNSRGVYMLIVKYQLQNKSNANYQGMLFKDLYWSCRESFLVSSDLALRAQLLEFVDHKLIKSKRNIDGSELLTIPINSSLLQQFLEEQQ